METVQTAHILAIASCLSTPAGGICTILLGKIRGSDDFIAVDICHGHFGCGDEIEIVGCDMIHLTLLVGELTCAIS